jgi:hypothetical protein
MRGASRSHVRSTSSAASVIAKLTGTAIARAVWRESLMHVNTTAASTVPVACDAFHNRPASSAKTRAPPGDWRREWWVERPCMEIVLVAFPGFVDGFGVRQVVHAGGSGRREARSPKSSANKRPPGSAWRSLVTTNALTRIVLDQSPSLSKVIPSASRKLSSMVSI